MATAQEAQRVYEEGVKLFESGAKSEALQTFYRATEVDPSCVDAWVALARAFHAINPEKYADEMLTSSERALSADPANARARNIASVAHFELGQIAFKREDWASGYNYFKRSYQIAPDPEVFSALRHCAEEGNLLADFADVCEERLKQSPDELPVKYALGVTATKMAIEAPSSPDKAWARTEFLRRAEAHLTDYLAADTLNPNANYFLGVVYLMTNRDDHAKHIVSKLYDIDSEKAADLEEMLND